MKKLQSLLVLLPIAFTGLSVPHSAAVAQQANVEPPSILINGVGEVYAKPDIAIFNFGVIKTEKSAKDALKENSDAMTKVFTELKAFGIESKHIRTSNFSIRPNYSRDKDKSKNRHKIVGYTVRNQATVKLEDLSKVGEILDKAISVGVNEGSKLEFANQNPNEIRNRAKSKAIENAFEQAKLIADAADVSLGKILEINVGSASIQPPMPRARSYSTMDESAAAADVPIEAGENVYRANISVRWEIKQ